MSSYPVRRHPRLKQHDYATGGAYFLTLCVDGRACLFGSIREGVMHLSPAGVMVHSVWSELGQRYAGVMVDEFIVMPNHMHGILILVDRDEPQEEPVPLSLSEILRRFKTFTANQYRMAMKREEWQPWDGTLWQRNYHEHVIRNDRDLDAVRLYIANNVQQWELDHENPEVRRDSGARRL